MKAAAIRHNLREKSKKQMRSTLIMRELEHIFSHQLDKWRAWMKKLRPFAFQVEAAAALSYENVRERVNGDYLDFVRNLQGQSGFGEALYNREYLSLF